jgi:hypothetical protein
MRGLDLGLDPRIDLLLKKVMIKRMDAWYRDLGDPFAFLAES